MRVGRAAAVKGKKKSNVLFRAAVVLLLAAIGVVLLDMRLHPELRAVAQNRAQQLAGQLAAQSVAQALGEQGDSSLVQVQRQEGGAIASIETNVSAANRLKSGVELALAQAFASEQLPQLNIPIGSLSGFSFLSGGGPQIPFTLVLAGSPQVNWESALEEGGINQTVHRVRLTVCVKVSAMLPGMTVEAESQTSYLAAETVIVGQVPQFFAGLQNRE